MGFNISHSTMFESEQRDQMGKLTLRTTFQSRKCVRVLGNEQIFFKNKTKKQNRSSKKHADTNTISRIYEHPNQMEQTLKLLKKIMKTMKQAFDDRTGEYVKNFLFGKFSVNLQRDLDVLGRQNIQRSFGIGSNNAINTITF